MCCGKVSNSTKIKSQQFAEINQLEVQAEYQAAMSMHNAAIGLKQRAEKRNKAAQQKKKLYR